MAILCEKIVGKRYVYKLLIKFELNIQKSRKVPFRDPSRWRFDSANNPVCKQLIGCFGVACYEFDHVIPYSKGISDKFLGFPCSLNFSKEVKQSQQIVKYYRQKRIV